MKLLILLVFSSICCIHVQCKVLSFATAVFSNTLLKCGPRNSSLDVSQTVVYFYDLQHNYSDSFPIDKAAQGILSIKNLDIKKYFYIYVGGFKSQIANDTTTDTIKNALKRISESYLIIVDHSAYTNGYLDRLTITNYDRSVKCVPSIGKKIAEMLADLKKRSVSPRYMQCIGHSLGAQILGYAGEHFKELTGQKISRITALDPAGPCFVGKSNDHIRSGMAEYIEIYHCNAGVLGSDKSLGDVNFIADDGKYMSQCGKPSCSLNLCNCWKAAQCSHTMCVTMWAASMANPSWFRAYKCDNYKNYEKCKHSGNAETTAGFWNPSKANGTYYFSTKDLNLL